MGCLVQTLMLYVEKEVEVCFGGHWRQHIFICACHQTELAFSCTNLVDSCNHYDVCVCVCVCEACM